MPRDGACPRGMPPKSHAQVPECVYRTPRTSPRTVRPYGAQKTAGCSYIMPRARCQGSIFAIIQHWLLPASARAPPHPAPRRATGARSASRCAPGGHPARPRVAAPPHLYRRRSSRWSAMKPMGHTRMERSPRADQLAHLLQDVRPQPRLRRAPRALEGEVPATLSQPQLARHTARRRQQLALIGIVPLADAFAAGCAR